MVLCIEMPVTTSFETTTPVQVIQECKGICARAKCLQWWNSAVDIMVSGFDGNAEDDLIKKKVIYMKYAITAMKSCESLLAIANRIVTGYTNPVNWTNEALHWQEEIRKDNHLLPKPQHQATSLQQEHTVMGCVINDMVRQDAESPVAPACSETEQIADAQEMIAKARGESNALCIKVPTLEQVHS